MVKITAEYQIPKNVEENTHDALICTAWRD
jgi:hypothetical protein